MGFDIKECDTCIISYTKPTEGMQKLERSLSFHLAITLLYSHLPLSLFIISFLYNISIFHPLIHSQGQPPMHLLHTQTHTDRSSVIMDTRSWPGLCLRVESPGVSVSVQVDNDGPLEPILPGLQGAMTCRGLGLVTHNRPPEDWRLGPGSK